jgi:hypothetical protein
MRGLVLCAGNVVNPMRAGLLAVVMSLVLAPVAAYAEPEPQLTEGSVRDYESTAWRGQGSGRGAWRAEGHLSRGRPVDDQSRAKLDQ